MKSAEIPGTQAVGRAAAILRAIASSGPDGYPLGEIAGLTGIEKPTTHRILRRLVEEGFLTQQPSSRAYRLGPLLYELGLAAEPSIPARQWCKQALEEISRLTGDSAFLIVRSGRDSVCMDRTEGHFPIKVLVLGVGQRRPLGCGAGSIALMSLLDDAEVGSLLEHNAERLRSRGEPSVETFLEIIQQARAEGVASKDAPDLPVRTLSMPVVDRYGHGICALSVTSLTSRVIERKPMLVDTLRSITHELSERLRSNFQTKLA